jgi:small subunit ribosomal protein S17
MAHDELGCQIGDQVRIVESMPISRRKRWVVEEIIRRDIGAAAEDVDQIITAEVEQVLTGEVEQVPAEDEQ